jgi:hypothetical protein
MYQLQEKMNCGEFGVAGDGAAMEALRVALTAFFNCGVHSFYPQGVR